jgi:signal transduction histidine kinase/Tfp pilus assembly protein PilF
MKKIYICLVIALFMSVICADDFQVLKNKLINKKLSPQQRVDLLLSVAVAGTGKQPDSLLVFTEEAYFLAQENNYYLGKVKAAIVMAGLLQKMRNLTQAEMYLDNALAIAQKNNLNREIGKIHFFKSTNYIFKFELDPALEQLLLAEKYEKFLDLRTIMRIYNNLANISFYRSNYAPALDYYLKQQTLAEQENNFLELGFALTGIANIHNNLGNFEVAEQNYFKSIQAFDQSSNPENSYAIRGNLGTIYSQTGQPLKARKLYEELLEQAIAINDIENIYIAYNNFGVIELIHNREYSKALSFFQQAHDYATQFGDEYNIANVLMNIGACYQGLNDLDNAFSYLTQSIELANKIGVFEISSKALKYLLQVKSSTIDDPEVAELLRQYLDVQVKIGEENVLGVMQINQQHSQNIFDQTMQEIELKKQIAEKDLNHQKSILYFSIAFLIILFVALIFVISLNKKLRRLRDNLQHKVDESIQQIRQQDSILIMQNHQAAMGEMLSMIAHQWKQPLNSISLIAQNIEDAYKFDELTRELIQKSVKETTDLVTFMSNTINSFRNYFIIGEEKQFSLQKAIDLSFDYSQVILKNYNISPTCHFSQDFHMEGQINLLIQVFLILINNSRDAFIQNNIQTRNITFSASNNDNNQIILSYADNAGGIPQSIINSIFEPYFSTKGTDNGTGIGLYIAKSIINQKFKGTITAQTDPPTTTFTLTFPSTQI